jgi:hypothetical protein
MVSNSMTKDGFREINSCVMRWELEEKGGLLLNCSILRMIIDNVEDLWIGSTFKWRQRGANTFYGR